MSEFETTDYQASITLLGDEVTIRFKFENEKLAGQMASELIEAYHSGEPVTITLSQPAPQYDD